MKREICALLSTVMLLGSGGSVLAADKLLVNGDFEAALAGSDDWKFQNSGGWYYGADPTAAEITDSQRHGGSSSLMVQNATVGQRVTLEAGKKYTLTAYVKADAATDSPDIGFYNGAMEYPASAENAVAMKDVSAATEWQEVTVEFECTAAQDYVICLMAWDDDVNVYFDDVTLSESDIPFEGGGVANGDFADASAWKIEGAGSIANGVFAVSGTDYESRLSQTAEGLENGVYDLNAYVTSSDISGTAYLYAKTEGHTMASTSIPMTEAAMYVTVPGVVVDDGRCDIGLYASGSSSITLDNVSLSASEDTRVQFLKGGEISKLTYVEDQGARFFRADGTEADALQIMAENGFNLARIRLLDDPGKGHGDGTYYLPEYYMTEEDCLELARRAKDKGMQICFTFAYSDYWVDGDKQMVPYAWQQEIDAQGLKGEDLVEYLENKVYEYTKDVMEKLIAQGTQPEFVSVGNEVQVGILFNRNNHDNGLYNNAGYLARLLSSGAKAVRDTSPETKIIFHSDNGGNLYRRSTFVSALRSIDSSLYDVIGVSYYPYYNAEYSIDTVVNDFAKVIDEFDKDVIIMETGYNWNDIRGDGWEGQLKDSGYYQDIYGETQDGQRAFLTELYAKLKQVAGGRCIGDMYWDPVMVYDGGDYTIGWAIRESDDQTEGNVVSNSTIFDFEGKAVAGQLAMRYNTNADDNINITGTVTSGGAPEAEKEITVNVNGAEYTVTTDKFGEYIVSVPYPADGKLNISAQRYENTYSVDAPYDGILVENIDLASDKTPPTPTVPPVTEVTGISIGSLPYNTTVTEGMPLDVSGLEITAQLSNSFSIPVTDYTLSGYDKDKPGTQTITVKYLDFTASFEITVVEKQLTGIAVSGLPAKRNYSVGEELELDGLEVTAVYDNNTSEAITGYSVSGYDPQTAGLQTVTVEYEGFSAAFTVTVTEAEQSGEAVQTPKIGITGFIGGKTISLTTATDGAAIYYTTDGTLPTESSALYSGPITVTETTVIKAVAVKEGMENSKTASGRITVSEVGSLKASHESGEYPAGTVITLSCPTSGVMIYYTTDGSDPTVSDSRYNGSVALTNDMTLKAVAVKDGYKSSDVFEVSYTVTKPEPSYASLSVGSAAAAAGDTVSLPVYLFAESEITGYRFTVSYDPSVFEYDSITPAEGVDAMSLFTSVSEGKITVFYSGDDAEAGELCSINLNVLSSAVDGAYDINISEASVSSDTELDVEAIGGSVELEGSANSMLDISAETIMTDKNGNSIEKAEDIEEAVTANVMIDSGAQQSEVVNLIFAVYDRAGAMVSLSTMQMDVSSTGEILTHTIDIPENVSVGSIKVMIWNSLNEMSPVSQASGII